MQLDTRASSSRKSGGLRLSVTADMFPRLWDGLGTVATLESDARVYVPMSRLPLEPYSPSGRGPPLVGTVLLVRCCIRRGQDHPAGYDHDRFAGDAAAYAGADLRLLITRFARPVPGELGVLGLVDAGRVWLSGKTPISGTTRGVVASGPV
jgi:hypothetical protein